MKKHITIIGGKEAVRLVKPIVSEEPWPTRSAKVSFPIGGERAREALQPIDGDKISRELTQEARKLGEPEVATGYWVDDANGSRFVQTNTSGFEE